MRKLRLKRKGNSQSPFAGKKTASGQQPIQLPAPKPEARHNAEQPTGTLFPSVSRDLLVDDEADSFPSDVPQRPAYVRKVAKSHFNEDLYSSNESLSQVHVLIKFTTSSSLHFSHYSLRLHERVCRFLCVSALQQWSDVPVKTPSLLGKTNVRW